MSPTFLPVPALEQRLLLSGSAPSDPLYDGPINTLHDHAVLGSVAGNDPLSIDYSGDWISNGNGGYVYTGGWVDSDLDAVTFIKLTNTRDGVSTLDPVTGTFTYLPRPGFVGEDSFTYRLSDGTANSNGTATVTLNATNVYPAAQSDSYYAIHDRVIQGNVSNNDYLEPDGFGGWLDVDGDAVTFIVETPPAPGLSFDLNPTTGAFTYQPLAGYVGSDLFFTYKLSDGVPLSSMMMNMVSAATVSLSFSNSLPSSRDGYYCTLHDSGPHSVADDYDSYELTSNGNGGWQDTDGDTVTFILDSSPSHGMFTLDSTTGSYTYTPDAPDADSSSEYRFTYHLADSITTSSPATVRIYDPEPQDDSYSTIINGSVAGNVGWNDLLQSNGAGWQDFHGGAITFEKLSDPTSNDPSFPVVANDFQFDPATGNFTFDPLDGFVGSVTFDYQLRDGSSASIYSATVTMEVSFPFDAVDDNSYANTDPATKDAYPTINYFVLNGNRLEITAAQGVLKNDTQPEYVQYLTAHQYGTGGVYGKFSIQEDGGFTYKPYAWVFNDPNFSGRIDYCQYYAEDPSGKKDGLATVAVDLAEISITRNGIDVDSSPEIQTLWVGEKVVLSASVKGNVTLAGVKFQWGVGDIAVDGYTGYDPIADPVWDPDTSSVGHDLPLTADELKLRDIDYYWVDGGGKESSVTMQVLGQTTSDIQSFTVDRPNSQITTVTTQVVPGVNLTEVVYQFGISATSPGIRFTRSLDQPADDAGTFRWTQIITKRKVTRQTSATTPREVAFATNDDGALDGKPSYEFSDEFTGRDIPTGGFPQSYIYFRDDFTATTYLMYKPDSADSIWVPVQAVAWGFWAEFTRTGTNNWHLDQDLIATDPSGEDTSFFPEWDAVYRPFKLDDLSWSPVN